MRPAKRPAAGGFTLIELLVAGSLMGVLATGTAAILLATARGQARLLRMQAATDAGAVASVTYMRSPTPPAIPTSSPVSGCALSVLDASGAPFTVEMQSTCGDGPQAVSIPFWLTWAPPAPPAP